MNDGMHLRIRIAIHIRSFIIHHSSFIHSAPMSTAEPWTVGRLLQWTADYLKGHGSESPRLDAEVLLAEALGCQRIELYTTFEDVPERDGPRGVPRIGPPPGRGHAGGLSGRPAGVLLALVPRHARRADSPAGDRVAGGGGARSGEDEGQGAGGRGQAEQSGRSQNRIRISQSPIPIPHPSPSPTSARAAASSPSAWPNTCPPAA